MGSDHMYDPDAMDRVVAELGHRPVDGDAEVVRAYAATCTGIETVIDGLLPGLDAIAQTSQDQQSEAVVELCRLAGRVTSRLGKVRERYGTMGSSLASYAETLDGACSQSWQAFSDAQTALSSLDLHKAQLSTLKADQQTTRAGMPDSFTAGAGLSLHLHLRSGLRYDANDTLQVAKIDDIDLDYVALEAARSSMTSAWDTLDSAATAVVATLKALHDDGLDDGLRENVSKVGNALHLDDLRTWVSDHLDDIATVLGVAALLLCWVPVVGQVLAVAAAVASLAVLATAVVDLCQDGATAAEWQAAGWAALGVVSFGVGRVASKGVQIAGRTSSATTRAGANAGTKAAGGSGKAVSGTGKAATETSGSTTRELLSPLNPRNVARDYAAEIQAQAKNPNVRDALNSNVPFASGYTNAQRASGWPLVEQGAWTVGTGVVLHDFAVRIPWDNGSQGLMCEPGQGAGEAPATSPVIAALPEAQNTDVQQVVPEFRGKP